MSDESRERLKEFRSQYASSPSSGSKLLVLQLVIMLLGFGALIAIFLSGQNGAVDDQKMPITSAGLTADQLREYAVHLAGKKHFSAAIGAYDEYLAVANLDSEARSKVCYSVAKLAIDSEDYSKGLEYLYQAEYLSPESELKDEIDKKVVLCLDKLGRTVDLRKELRTRSSVKRTSADVAPGEKVLAEFGDDVITDRDLELEIEKMPAYVRESLGSVEKKTELLKNLVAQRLLLDKARRLELDKAPEIQNQLADQLDAMIVQKLITDEVQSKINITPADVERYYKAEQDQFFVPASAEVLVASGDSEEAVKSIENYPDKSVKVTEGSGFVPGVGQSADALTAIFSTAVDGLTTPVQIGEAWYLFKVKSKTAKKQRTFAEVKEQVSQRLQMQKQQEQLQLLIEETLKARNVKLYADRLNQEAPSVQ